MELRQLRYFVRTCEAGTVTAAATQLFVTEQTVSYALKKLEAELGCTLLVRSKQGVAPTAEGALLLEKARVVLDNARDIEETFGRNHNVRGTVRFRVCTMSVPENGKFSLRAIDSFCDTYPQIEVHTIECPSRNCIKAIIDGDADLAFVYSSPRTPELEIHTLYEGEVVMAVAHNHPLASRDNLRIEDLKGETLLYANNGGDTYKLLEERCREHGFEIKYHTVPSLYYLDAVASGQGLAPALAGHPLLGIKPGLAALPFSPEDRLVTPLNFIVKRSLRPDAPARLLMEWLLREWNIRA